jgi:hypothetical protein
VSTEATSAEVTSPDLTVPAGSTVSTAPTAPAVDHRSTAELVKLAAEQLSTLVRTEMKLAQVELTQKGKRAGLGFGMYGGAGVVAHYGGAVLIAAAILGIATALPAWLAALIIGAALLVAAGLLALLGRGQMRKATPAVPQDTVASVKADIDTITHSVKDRAQR